MADTDSSLTPEKRLLKLIEEPAGARSAPSAVKEKKAPKIAAPKMPSLDSLMTPDMMLAQFAVVKERVLAFLRNEGPPLDLRQINRTMKVFVGGMLVYFAGSLGYEIFTMGKWMTIDTNITQHDAAVMPIPDERKYAVDLFDDPTRRNVFVPYEKPVVKNAEEQESNAMSLKLLEITKDLKLTGISANPADPAQTFCMVEDVKKDMTSFLKVGDTINGLNVAEIKQDSVILSYEKERIEIR